MASSRRPPSPSRVRTALAAGLVALALAVWPRAAEADVAVVVHPGVSVDALTLVELRKVMRGDRQYWTPGKPITIIVRAPDAPERTLLLDRIYQMSEAEYRRYWVAKVFRAEATDAPKVVISNQKAAELVSVLPGAIALIASEDVPEGLKVLAIDGAKPGAKGYPLR